jgi:hypothetical protein
LKILIYSRVFPLVVSHQGPYDSPSCFSIISQLKKTVTRFSYNICCGQGARSLVQPAAGFLMRSVLVVLSCPTQTRLQWGEHSDRCSRMIACAPTITLLLWSISLVIRIRRWRAATYASWSQQLGLLRSYSYLPIISHI